MNNEEAANVLRIMASGIELKGYTQNWISYFKKAYEKAVKVLEERPQGKWIFLKANEERTDGVECSVCKTSFHVRVPYFAEFNFCPWCGADMRKGEQNGN